MWSQQNVLAHWLNYTGQKTILLAWVPVRKFYMEVYATKSVQCPLCFEYTCLHVALLKWSQPQECGCVSNAICSIAFVIVVLLQPCYSRYPIHEYLRGSCHWILLAGHVILLGLCVDATSSIKIIQLSLLKIRRNSITLQVLRLIGNIIIYIYPLRNFHWSLWTNKLIINGVVLHIYWEPLLDIAVNMQYSHEDLY
jgi:hypothetical protein